MRPISVGSFYLGFMFLGVVAIGCLRDGDSARAIIFGTLAVIFGLVGVVVRATWSRVFPEYEERPR